LFFLDDLLSKTSYIHGAILGEEVSWTRAQKDSKLQSTEFQFSPLSNIRSFCSTVNLS